MRGQQSSFRQDEVALYQRRLAHDAPHVWGEGLGAVHQLHDLQSLQFGILRRRELNRGSEQ